MREIVEEALRYIEAKYERGEAFTNPKMTADFFCLRLGLRESEVFACAFLDSKHRLITVEELFFGTIDGTSVYPREVVKAALTHNAAAVIFAHNLRIHVKCYI